MIRNALGVVLVAALVVLAGCSGAPGGLAGTATDGNGTDGGSGTAGSINFYISDEPNAIEDFEHLNVTITKVGLHRVGGANDSTATPNETATETPANTSTPSNATDSASATPTLTDEGEEKDEGESKAEWVEYDVNKTVDLTRLVGANATKLDVLEAPAGSYDKVFVYVSDINATLKNGESVNVKLPSEKLHINKQFEVGNGSSVDFVFDIAVHKAGKSGKYILKPVVSQSGTDVDIEDVDETDEEKEDEEREEESEDADAAELEAEFVGKVAAGQDATVKVTGADGPVENATVAVNGEVVGETAADGTLTFAVPEDAEELSVTVTKGDAEAELERELGAGGGNTLAAVA